MPQYPLVCGFVCGGPVQEIVCTSCSCRGCQCVHSTATGLLTLLQQLASLGCWGSMAGGCLMWPYQLYRRWPTCQPPDLRRYMTKDGRISMAGLNSARAEYLAQAIDDSVRNF